MRILATITLMTFLMTPLMQAKTAKNKSHIKTHKVAKAKKHRRGKTHAA